MNVRYEQMCALSPRRPPVRRRLARDSPNGRSQAGAKVNLNGPHRVVRIGVQKGDRLPVPSVRRPPTTGSSATAGPAAAGRDRRRGRASRAGEPRSVARQQPVQGRHQVRIGARASSIDHDPGRGMRDEDDEQAVALAGDESLAVGGQIVQPAVPPVWTVSSASSRAISVRGSRWRRASRTRPTASARRRGNS